MTGRNFLTPIAILFSLLTLLALTAVSARAQESGDVLAQVAPQEQAFTLLELIKAGGLTMVPLGLFSIAAVALVIRNFLTLKESRLLPPGSVAELQHTLAAHNVNAARRHCKSERSMLTATVEAGLERITSDELRVDNIKEAMEEAGTEQMLSLMRPISYLSIIGTVSPMLGLLGTVSGMIKAFQAISTGGMGKPEILAGHIGEALVTTATGLIIAIPTMIFYFYFKNNFLKTMASLGRITGRLLDALTSETS